MKIRIKLLLIMVLMLLSFILSFLVYSYTLTKIEKIQIEEMILQDLKVSAILTKDSANQLLVTQDMSSQWLNFSMELEKLNDNYEKLKSFTNIPNLSDNLQLDIQSIIMMKELELHQYEKLLRKYDALISFLDSIPSYSAKSFRYIHIYRNSSFLTLEDYRILLYLALSFETEISKSNSILDASIKIVDSKFNHIFLEIEDIKRKSILLILIITLCIIFISITLSMVVADNISRDTIKIVKKLKSINEKGFSVDFNINRKDEIGFLASELSVILNQLFETRNKVFSNEKIAALSNLTIGLAHEINTPLGICLTANSHIINILQSEKFDKSSLMEMNVLVSSNIAKIVKLVNSFKELSINNDFNVTSETNITEYIQEFTKNYLYLFNKNNIKVIVNNEENVIKAINKENLNRVLVLLVDNSIIHAFGHTKEKIIIIDIFLKNDILEIIFYDNGIGMSEKVLEHIFEPFYTTKRSQGNTGLGLHLVYNIITMQMNGQIKCESNVDNGTAFIITL